MKYSLRFFFEYGGHCLWAGDEKTQAAFGYSIENENLPISKTLAEELCSLEKEFQTSLNWDCPSDPSPWTEEQWQEFKQKAKAAFDRLTLELGETFQVKNETHWW